MTKRKIFLVRHGKIKLDKGKCYIGQIDIPLSDIGIEQAYKLQKEFSNIKIDNIFCSDLTRSVETARIIGNCHNSSFEILKELREINVGVWEGLTFDYVKNNYKKEYKLRGEDFANYAVNGGESFLNCQKRAWSALMNIVNTTQGNVLISCHAGVIRTIMCKILEINLQNLFKIGQDYGCYNILTENNNDIRISRVNILPNNI